MKAVIDDEIPCKHMVCESTSLHSPEQEFTCLNCAMKFTRKITDGVKYMDDGCYAEYTFRMYIPMERG